MDIEVGLDERDGINEYFDSLSKRCIGNGDGSEYIYKLCIMLNALGYNVGGNNRYTYVYDTDVSNAIKAFKKVTYGTISIDPNCDKDVYLDIYKQYLESLSIDADEEDELDEEDTIPNPHYDPFFDFTKNKTHRKNHKDIKIVFGNSSITKRIVDVYMRSVSVEVDTSGNPISEIYEFVARDIVESDESTDENNYSGIISPGNSSSDIQYIFNLGSYSNTGNTSSDVPSLNNPN